MSLSNEELAAIRERAENEPLDVSLANQHGAERDRAALLAEVERLRGERDEIAAAAGKAAYERDQLQARLDKVRALHTCELGGTPTGEPADACSCGVSYYPCPTIQAIDGSDQ